MTTRHESTRHESAPAGHSTFDLGLPAAARRYDALLGGKDNFSVDRHSARTLEEAFPAIRLAALENRRFMQRAVRYLADDRGMRQFLDIGVGIPSRDGLNVHEIAQDVDPSCRVAYVDNDPVVAVHARAWLENRDRSTYLDGDLREPGELLRSASLRATIDFDRPVALLLIAVLHFLEDSDEPLAAVAELVDALPAGSHVALTHVTFDHLPPHITARLRTESHPDAGHGPFQARTHEQVAAFLRGLEPVDPGLVSTVHWHPDRLPRAEAAESEAAAYAVVALKP